MKLLKSTKFFLGALIVLVVGVSFEAQNQMLTFQYCSGMLLLSLIEFRIIGQNKGLRESLLKW